MALNTRRRKSLTGIVLIYWTIVLAEYIFVCILSCYNSTSPNYLFIFIAQKWNEICLSKPEKKKKKAANVCDPPQYQEDLPLFPVSLLFQTLCNKNFIAVMNDCMVDLLIKELHVLYCSVQKIELHVLYCSVQLNNLFHKILHRLRLTYMQKSIWGFYLLK